MKVLKFRPDYKDVIESLEWSWNYYSTSGELDRNEINCIVDCEIEFHTEYLIEEGYTNEEVSEVLSQMGFAV